MVVNGDHSETRGSEYGRHADVISPPDDADAGYLPVFIEHTYAKNFPPTAFHDGPAKHVCRLWCKILIRRAHSSSPPSGRYCIITMGNPQAGTFTGGVLEVRDK
jgi:hypothetical protein